MTAFNDQVAFLHVPKTGGKSCRKYMKKHLPGIRECDDGLPEPHSYGHIALRDMERFYGRHHSEFERIVAVVRNPYDHHLSQWLFWKDEYARGMSHVARAHAALHADLAHWLLDPMSEWHVWDDREINGKAKTIATAGGYAEFGGYYRYWLADPETNEVPENVCIVRFESLGEDFPLALKPWVGSVHAMDHVNAGPGHSPDPMLYYAPMARELVERRFPWAFENMYPKYEPPE